MGAAPKGHTFGVKNFRKKIWVWLEVVLCQHSKLLHINVFLAIFLFLAHCDAREESFNTTFSFKNFWICVSNILLHLYNAKRYEFSSSFLKKSSHSSQFQGFCWIKKAPEKRFKICHIFGIHYFFLDGCSHYSQNYGKVWNVSLNFSLNTNSVIVWSQYVCSS